jgi:hypothetical protein
MSAAATQCLSPVAGFAKIQTEGVSSPSGADTPAERVRIRRSSTRHAFDRRDFPKNSAKGAKSPFMGAIRRVGALREIPRNRPRVPTLSKDANICICRQDRFPIIPCTDGQNADFAEGAGRAAQGVLQNARILHFPLTQTYLQVANLSRGVGFQPASET